MRRTIRAVHVSLVMLITAAVLVQAMLAGQFISGARDVLEVHAAVGGLLELAGLALLVVAIAHRLTGERSRVALIGSVALALALSLQAALGWAPGEVPTAVHVPLGVCIFAGSLLLSLAMRRVAAASRRMEPSERLT